MRNRPFFRPAVDALEGRLALSGMAIHPGVHVAAAATDSASDGVQKGDFQGQFGDQTSPDRPGTGEQVEGEHNDHGSADMGQVNSLQIQRSAASLRTAATPTRRSISGTVKGRYTIPLPEPGGSLTYTLEGLGQVAPLGQVAASGSVRTPSSAGGGRGQNQGLLTLSNAQGTLTLRLTGPVQARVTSLVNRFAVQSGTGAYRGLTGRGVVTLQLSPTSIDSGGQFTLTLLSGRRR